MEPEVPQRQDPPRGRVRWGILGTGFIARAFADGLTGSLSGELVAVASRSAGSAKAFATEFGDGVAPRIGIEGLLSHGGVDAIYIATPHPLHVDAAVACASAGVAVLCEKPAGLNEAEVAQAIGAARENGTFFMEAYMYRCAPQTNRLIELIRSGVIGDIHTVEARFCFDVPYEPRSRLFDPALGGGAILDVGGYPVTFVQLVAGLASGQPFAEMEGMEAIGRNCPTGVDEWTSAVATYPGGVSAMLTCATRLEAGQSATVFGSQGTIYLDDPWIPAKDGGGTELRIQRPGEKEERVTVIADRPLYSYEADLVASVIANPEGRGGEPPWPALSWNESLATIRTLDRWRGLIAG